MVVATVPHISSTTGIGAEEEEYFAVLTEHGTETGRTELRRVVHATGLYHRAVYCFVFNSDGQLLIQRRSSMKRVGPNKWDLSVAEHLTPGEGYAAAAERGLQEELGITVEGGVEALHGPLGPVHRRSLHMPAIGITDNEFVESYCLDGYDGPIKFNSAEVTEVKFVAMDELQRQIEEGPENFTQWFIDELPLVLPALQQRQRQLP